MNINGREAIAKALIKESIKTKKAPVVDELIPKIREIHLANLAKQEQEQEQKQDKQQPSSKRQKTEEPEPKPNE